VSEPFVGEIRLFAFNFAPVGWALCNGQLLSISQNAALFSLVGTYYGGDGISTFALPNLQSRVPIGQGQGPGLSPYNIGQTGGLENVTLTGNQMPTHTHSVEASAVKGGLDSPAGAVPGLNNKEKDYDAAPDGTTTMNASMIGTAGAGQPHPNIQPYLAITYCIALQGIYPSRN